ncbi:MAG: flagellar biosynthesis protein FlgM [Lentisphaeria bacterium]|nr:flagellar biosynthesis protein FlgM [Lentisphaeria bacterium]
MNEFPNIWDYGQLLAFSGLDGQTDFWNGLCLRTARGEYAFELKIQDPEQKAKIRYAGPAPERVELTGDFFRFHSGEKTASGVLADAWNLVLDGPFQLTDTADFYDSVAEGSRILLAVKGRLHPEFLKLATEELIARRAAFLQSHEPLSGVPVSAKRTERKALSQLKSQIYAPEGMIAHYWSTPDRWPHRHMWLWDSAFHAIGMRHYSPKLARDFISAMFDVQQPDGFIPLNACPTDLNRDRTQPPMLGLAMKLVNEAEPAPEWIAGLAPKLEHYLEWLMKHRDSDGYGLLEWAVEIHENCRSGESGMDNSPRFDGAVQLDAPDFNAYFASECEILAEFLPERRDYWLAQHDRICRGMNERLWSPEQELYVDYDVAAGCRTGILSSAGFLPLLCGAPTQDMAEKLAAHLTRPETFGTPLRVPSIAANNPAAYKKDMWRGPVWTNVNFLIALGLERYGFHDLARSIVQETLREQEKWYLECGTFFEFYDDRKETPPRQLERKGKMAPGEFHPLKMPFHDYGWSATLYLEMINRPEWR